MKHIIFFIFALLAIASVRADIEDAQKVQGQLTCDICVSVITAVQNHLNKDNATVAKVTALIEQTCATLGISGYCQSNIVPYIPSIYQSLINYLPPKTICKGIKLCDNKKNVEEEIILIEDIEETIESDKKKGPGENLKCTICTNIVRKVQKTIKNNKTLPAVINAVKRTCAALFVSQYCNNFIIPRITTIYQQLVNGATPLVVCQKLNVCPSVGPSPTPTPVPEPEEFEDDDDLEKVTEAKVQGDAKCSICTFFVDAVRNQIKSNVTSASVQAAVERVCSNLGIQPFCKIYIVPYIPQLVLLLSENIKPEVICQRLKLCKAAADELEIVLVEDQEPLIFGDSLKCDLCSSVVSSIERHLAQSNKTVAGVTKVTLAICEKLRITPFCQSLIIPNIPKVLNLLISKLPPKAVCKAIKLCD